MFSQIELIYSVEQGAISATDLAEAILGMNQCLKETAHLALIDFDDVFVLPIEKGSVKTLFVFVRNVTKVKPWQLVVGLSVVFSLINDGFDLIQKFGVMKVKEQTIEVTQSISDPRLLKLCQSALFREGARKVAQPLNEVNQRVTIKYGEKSFVVDCENKASFYESDLEVILPELIDGENVELHGEITRINKKTNDLGFLYKEKALSVSPIDSEEEIADYHLLLKAEEVIVKGIVFRQNMYQTPKIKFIEIKILAKDQLPFNFLEQ